jgi:hypothetical protein
MPEDFDIEVTDIFIPEEIIEKSPEIRGFVNEVEARKHLFQRKNKRREILISVPEWGMEVLIAAFSGTARGEYYAFNNEVTENYKGTGEFFKRLWFEQVRLGCLHPITRKPILQPADRDELMDGEDGAVIERLAVMVREVSGLNASILEAAKKKLQAHQNGLDTTSSLNGSTAKV